MWYLSNRRVLNSCMVVMFFLSVLQIWLPADCRAAAIRIFPGNGTREMIGMEDGNKSKRDLFQKYYHFNGTSFNFNGTGKGFEETKRRVPSCPDPLHN